ncbi:hypothetical protein C3L33_23013, partial [Rhododendron williamsianum]
MLAANWKRKQNHPPSDSANKNSTSASKFFEAENYPKLADWSWSLGLVKCQFVEEPPLGLVKCQFVEEPPLGLVKCQMTCDDDDYCEYEVNYEDGSYSRGNIAEEIMTVASTHSTSRIDVLFGCGFNNSETSGRNYPSVVGLQNTKRSLLGQIGAKAFSYCHDDKNNGAIQIGKNNARLWGWKTALEENSEGLYLVKFKDILVNNKTLNMPSYVFGHEDDYPETTGVMIDSGSEITHLHFMAFDALLTKIIAHMNNKGKRMSRWNGLYCWDNPGGVLDPSLAEIRFVFVDLALRLGPNAWRQKEQDSCLMITQYPHQLTIIGRYQLRNINLGVGDISDKGRIKQLIYMFVQVPKACCR